MISLAGEGSDTVRQRGTPSPATAAGARAAALLGCAAAGTMAAGAPPSSWPRYFDDEHAPDDRRAALVDELIAFFVSDAGAAFLERGGARVPAGIAVALDHGALVAAAGSPDLVASLEVQPDEGLACLACAVHEVRRLGGRIARCGSGGPFRRLGRPRAPGDGCRITPCPRS